MVKAESTTDRSGDRRHRGWRVFQFERLYQVRNRTELAGRRERRRISRSSDCRPPRPVGARNSRNHAGAAGIVRLHRCFGQTLLTCLGRTAPRCLRSSHRARPTKVRPIPQKLGSRNSRRFECRHGGTCPACRKELTMTHSHFSRTAHPRGDEFSTNRRSSMVKL